MLAVAVFCAGCIDTKEMAEQIKREDEFAQRFIQDLHAGGLPEVRDRIKPATLQGPQDVEAEFAVMLKRLPAGEIDSVRLAAADIEKHWQSTESKLAYRVYGGGKTAQIDLWIETSKRGRLVETLRVLDGGAVAAPGARGP
jgi:hypothetical protein